MLNASAKGDISKVNQCADAALKIASKQNWPEMQTVIHMAVGATYLNGKDIEKALKNYRLAKETAAKAEEAGYPAGPKLFIQARFAEGGALVSDGRFIEAAKVYEEIAPLTKKQEDHLLTVESWRMAGYCYESVKKPSEAWRCGNLALDAGYQLDEEMRKNSTLPYVGEGLLRLIKKDKRNQDLENSVRQRLIELVGPDWEKKLETGASAQ